MRLYLKQRSASESLFVFGIHHYSGRRNIPTHLKRLLQGVYEE
jgi:hypothetical protein